jgi:hypothetical protein
MLTETVTNENLKIDLGPQGKSARLCTNRSAGSAMAAFCRSGPWTNTDGSNRLDDQELRGPGLRRRRPTDARARPADDEPE